MAARPPAHPHTRHLRSGVAGLISMMALVALLWASAIHPRVETSSASVTPDASGSTPVIPSPTSSGSGTGSLAPPPALATTPGSDHPDLFLAWSNRHVVFRVPILMYHVVGSGSDAPHELPSLVVSQRAFQMQLAALSAGGWRTITMAELAADLAADRPPRRHSFVLTFDDGHLDGLTVVLPILQRLDDTATYYLVTNRLGHRGYLTPGDVAQLASDGMDIGNHTVHHFDLATLGLSEVAAEINGAERDLLAIVGWQPVSLAFPSGEYDAQVVGALAASGIDLAVTTHFGALETYADRFTLPRVRITPRTTPFGLVRRLDALTETR